MAGFVAREVWSKPQWVFFLLARIKRNSMLKMMIINGGKNKN
jgi:hypothetical protein